MFHLASHRQRLPVLCLFVLAFFYMFGFLVPTHPISAASPAYLVKDIHRTVVRNNSSYAQGIYAIGNTVYFFAFDPDHGVELWKSDGTDSSTVLVKDIHPGLGLALHDSSSGIESPQFTSIGDTLFFVVDDGSYGHELWRSDGTEGGTTIVKDIYPGTAGSNPTELTNVDGTLFFIADDGLHGTELWHSDGTEEGTAIVADMSPGTTGSYVFDLTAVGNQLFFSALVLGTESNVPLSIWKSDGTEAGTVRVHTLTYPCQWGNVSLTNSLTNIHGTVFFIDCLQPDMRELWRSDGTDNGTFKLTNLSGYDTELAEFTPVGNTLFFRDHDQLWRSDGTVAGTMLVKAIKPSRLASVNNTLFFAGDDGTTGSELWRSDGSTAGTVMVKDINPGSPGANPINITQFQDTFFFAADDGAHGYELWRSDGTNSGTTLLRDIHAGSTGAFTEYSANYPWIVTPNGTLFFSADDGVVGGELWRSDGSAEGTLLVKDINGNRTDGDSYLYSYSNTDVNGVLFFTASDDNTGQELWRSDGTEAGTFLVKDIAPGTQSSYPYDLTNVNGTLFFMADDTVHGRELWRSDGTTAGTMMVVDLALGSQSSSIFSLVSMNGTLFFSASLPDQTRGLWRSDGTAAGTTKIKDGDVGYIATVNDELFFTTSGHIWKSDGTTAGTVLLKSIAGYPSFGYSSQPALVNGMVFFTVEHDYTSDGDPGVYGTYELWRSDGTSGGTILLKAFHPEVSNRFILADMQVMGNKVYFTGTDADHGDELWSSDGTQAGTQLVDDIYPGIGSSTPMDLTETHNTLFFSAVNANAGRELWRSDGTTAGTSLVKDIAPGSSGSTFDSMMQLDGTLFFTADDGVSGFELWHSDGSSAGTSLVQDIAPGYASSTPGDLVASNGLLFFTADDQVHGYELWALHPALITTPTATITHTATATLSSSPTATPTDTATPTSTTIATIIATMTSTVTATATPSPTPGAPLTSLEHRLYVPDIVR